MHSNSTQEMSAVRRCTKCVLPESLPGSQFNEQGECVWCQRKFPNYRPMGEDKLRNLLEEKRSASAPADCLVGISGGKDSSYVVMALQKHFGMRVEAFTYVHDGLTDFAFRNAQMVCETLGVQHHQVSLPGHGHLDSFKAFFADWVETEKPLSAAMTCVACKHLHILGTRLAKDRGIPMVVWSVCPLETPPFIPAQPESGTNEKSRGMFGMGLLLARALVTQPRFCKAFLWHPSICVQGCLAFRPDSSYLQKRYSSVTHIQYFEYCQWNGRVMIETLREQTPWSIPESVVSDWHSDCLFNVFKEYMFQKMLGASYTDAFLSNQIRHGLMTRDEAMIELRRSKQYFASEVPKTLALLGLNHLQERCDPSCFNIGTS